MIKVKKLFKQIAGLIMLHLNKQLFEKRILESEIAILQNRILEIDEEKRDLVFKSNSLKSDSEILQEKIEIQKNIETEIFKELNQELNAFGVNANLDNEVVWIKENEVVIDCFCFNDELNEFENDNTITKGKFSSKKIHVQYAESINFIYEQLEKLSEHSEE